MTTFYLDPVNGNDAADGSTFALGGLPTVGPWKTITSGATAARIAPGDVIRIAKSPDPSSLGQTALWTNLSRDVVLQTGAVTLNFDLCESAWVASANVTATADTTQYKEGSKSAKIGVAAAFNTGLAAYKDLGSSIDFSAYQQLSFWIRNSAAFTAGQLQIKFCSDNAGATPVDANHVFSLPAIPSTNQWMPITIDKGGAFGRIRSIGLYVVTDFGAVDICLDNLIACKAPAAADSLTLQSLISKNSSAQGGMELWYPIQSINSATIKIDNHVNCLGNAGRGYTGTTETVTIYKRETIKTAMAAGSSTSVQAVQDNGSPESLIEFQGGYDPGTNTQNGETIFDGLNGNGYGLDTNSKTYVKINYLGAARYNQGGYINGWYGYGHIIGNFRGLGNTASGLAGSNLWNTFIGLDGYIVGNNNGSRGVDLSGMGGVYCLTGSVIYAYGNLDSGLLLGGLLHKLKTVILKNNTKDGADFGSANTSLIETLTTADNTEASIRLNASYGCVIKSLTYAEGTLFYNGFSYTYHPARIIINSVNGNSADKRIITYNGVVYAETSVRHTGSGFAWKLTPQGNAGSASRPLFQKVAEIAVNASAKVTVSAWMQRTSSGITGSLICRGGQIAGVDSDVKTDMTVAANTWEQVTITFTPTEAGVVEIEVWAYGSTAYSVYIDDMAISQAA
ncbi:MAG: hypothetical protein ACHQ2F_10425 [Desulfobaccales bacterium]